MLEAPRAVISDPVFVGTGTHRRAQEGPHVVDGILEAAGLLNRGAAAQVDESAGQRGGTTPPAGALQDHNLSTGPRRLDGRRNAGDAVTGDHHIGFGIPVCDVASINGRDGHIAASASEPDQSWPQ